MKLKILVASAPMILFCTFVFGSPEKLSPADEASAFKAAGFKLNRSLTTVKKLLYKSCN